MKVRVVLSVDVDVQAWRDEYSQPDFSAQEIREAIRYSIVDAAQTAGVIVPEGIIREVSLEGDRS